MIKRLLAIGVALSVLSTGALAQTVKYKFAVPASLTVPRGVVAKRFADEIEKRSQGKIVFEIFADSSFLVRKNLRLSRVARLIWPFPICR